MQNNFHYEIERKFLVNEINFPLDQFPSAEIIQGYISEPEDEVTIRLRKINDKYFRTLKKRGLESRLESEVEISEKEFNADWDKTERKRIRKTRYKIPYETYTIELDIFHEHLEGLIIAEVEFDTIADCKLFIPPSWFGQEVTNKKEFSNSYLSFYGYKKL